MKNKIKHEIYAYVTFSCNIGFAKKYKIHITQVVAGLQSFSISSSLLLHYTKYIGFPDIYKKKAAGQYDLLPLAKLGHALARISKLDTL